MEFSEIWIGTILQWHLNNTSGQEERTPFSTQDLTPTLLRTLSTNPHHKAASPLHSGSFINTVQAKPVFSAHGSMKSYISSHLANLSVSSEDGAGSSVANVRSRSRSCDWEMLCRVMQTGAACPAPGEAPCTHGISEKSTAARKEHGPWTSYMWLTESSRQAPHTWWAPSATRGEFGKPVIKDHHLLHPWGSLTSVFLKSLARCTAVKATTGGQDFQMWLSLFGNHFRQCWKHGKSTDTWRELQSFTCRKPNRVRVTALDHRANTLSSKPR